MSNDKTQFVTVVVLNDGETFTDIQGCSVCVVPLEQYEETIKNGGDARDFEPVVEIGLDNMTLPMSREDHIAFEDSLARARAIARRQAIEGEENA
jgi:hypothetical protein